MMLCYNSQCNTCISGFFVIVYSKYIQQAIKYMTAVHIAHT